MTNVKGVTAVIFDWAGTILDHGSRAPVATLQNVFESAGVPITAAEARLSMGIAKRDHIQSILAIPRVGEAWQTRHGRPPVESDTNALYADFIPKQTECLGAHSKLIRGMPETAAVLRARGIRIGSTTGYTRDMLDFLLVRAREQGFEPDCAVSPQDVPGGGRPAPWMCWLNAIRLQTSPLWSMVKIGDTPSDIEEGLNAGMWTVGVTRTGNEAGLTEEEWKALPESEQSQIVARAEGRLRGAGAHYLIESAAECPVVIDEISARLRAGDRP